MYVETDLAIRFALFCDNDHCVADDLVTDLVALLENLHHAAALLPVSGGGLRNSVHKVGVKRLVQRFDLGDVQRLKRLSGLVERHRDALLIIFIGTGGVGGHIQRIQNTQDLGHGVGHAVIELLVGLALAALAVVIILGGGAQQLVFQLLVLFSPPRPA